LRHPLLLASVAMILGRATDRLPRVPERATDTYRMSK
jgi:hypothetical protein